MYVSSVSVMERFRSVRSPRSEGTYRSHWGNGTVGLPRYAWAVWISRIKRSYRTAGRNGSKRNSWTCRRVRSVLSKYYARTTSSSVRSTVCPRTSLVKERFKSILIFGNRSLTKRFLSTRALSFFEIIKKLRSQQL